MVITPFKVIQGHRFLRKKTVELTSYEYRALIQVINSAKEVMVYPAFVCLFVCSSDF